MSTWSDAYLAASTAAKKEKVNGSLTTADFTQCSLSVEW
jgi:hypothetical protein